MALWVYTLLVVAISSSLLHVGVDGLGIDWGMEAHRFMHPRCVVQLCKDNNITRIRLYDADPWTVNNFAHSGIDVMIGVRNDQLASVADSYDCAKDWVRDYLIKARDCGVKICMVGVGNEPLLMCFHGWNEKTLFPALKNIQGAINDAGLGKEIKATPAQNGEVYWTDTTKPSDSHFRDDIKDLMCNLSWYLHEQNSPFMIHIHPFTIIYDNHGYFPLDMGFYDGSKHPIVDRGYPYQNLFDVNLDSVVVAMNKIGIKDPYIIVGETGWPSGGNDTVATVPLAHRYYHGFIRKMAAGKGSLLYKKTLEYYLFALTDEDKKYNLYEKHWGIFSETGQPKYPIDFTGTGLHEKMPIPAHNPEMVWFGQS